MRKVGKITQDLWTCAGAEFLLYVGRAEFKRDICLVAHRKVLTQKGHLLSPLGKVAQVYENEENHGRRLFEMQLYQNRMEEAGQPWLFPFSLREVCFINN